MASPESVEHQAANGAVLFNELKNIMETEP